MAKPIKKITAKLLRELGFCEDRVKRFEAEWPNGATITKQNVLRAVELGLKADWLAAGLLEGSALDTYEEAAARAWAAYKEAKARAWAAYLEATVPARDAYLKASALAFWRAWRATIGSNRKEFDDAH